MEPKLIYTAEPGRYWVVDPDEVVVETYDNGRKALQTADWLAKRNAKEYKVYDSQPKEG